MDIPGYEIVEVLGTGGFGTVYRAHQLAVRREVALKVDNRVLATDRDRRRFMREVTAAGRLSGHPHVVAVYDAGLLGDGRPYMVLELCPHGSLNDRLKTTGPFPVTEVRDIGVRIADALAAAHSAGVLHRDVKPANILIDGYGNVALADFGLAAMPAPGLESSATREALTPAYAPPEAFQLAAPTPAGDVYSLAASLYALLSGRPPHFPPDGRLGIAALMAAQLRPVPDLPGVPPELTAVLRQAMAYDPAARPPSAVALRDGLAALSLEATSQTAPPAMPAAWSYTETTPGVSAPRKPGTSRGLVLGAAGLVAAGILGAGALVAVSLDDDAPASPGGGAAARGGASSGKSAKRDVYGVPTVAENCPAAAVAGAKALCTKTAECWGGIVQINGSVAINRSDCAVGHVYETFAIAPMPSDGQTWNAYELFKHPTVRKVCAKSVMAASRFGAALKYPAKTWQISLVPPSQAQFEAQNIRVYRCVARLDGRPPVQGSVFRPRS